MQSSARNKHSHDHHHPSSAKQAHLSHMFTSAFIFLSASILADWPCSTATCSAVLPLLMTRVSMQSSARNKHSLVESVDVCALTDQRFDQGRLPFGSCIVKGRGAAPAAACVKSCAHSKCGISARPRSRCTSSQQHSKALLKAFVPGQFQRKLSFPAKQQTSALVTYVHVRIHLHKRFDTCRLVVFNSPMDCSPSSPDDARQHAFQRAQQALTRRERRRLRPD
jgi:hypothetical protein